MDHSKAAFKGCVEGLLGRFLLCRGAILDDGLGIFDVDIAEVVVPVLVCSSGSLGKFASTKGGIDFGGGGIELVKDPELSQGFMTGFSGMFLGFERGIEFAENVFSGLVDFVAELAVTMHLFYVEVDVAAYQS